MKLLFAITIVLSLGIVNSESGWKKFCNFECGKMHTICKTRCNVGPKCKYGVEVNPLSDTERELILNEHNKFRNKFSLGKEKYLNIKMKHKTVVNMNVLNYDVELEHAATCWGKRCEWNHDKCRSTDKYEHVGQNLAKYEIYFQKKDYYNSTHFDTLRLKLLTKKFLVSTVKNWYEEVKYIEADQLRKYFEVKGVKVGHFTQLAWANTVSVGCARVLYKVDDPVYKYRQVMQLICNYGPGGNILRRPVVEFGPRSKRCSKGKTTNLRYPGLCGKLEKIIPKNSTGPQFFFKKFNRYSKLS